MVYVTAHGMYEAQINGQRVGSDYLTPGWTAYQKRLQYQTYDVTGLLKNGPNAIGVTLGSGWWRGNIGFENGKEFYGQDVSLLFQLDIEFTDGSHQITGSDGTWKYATDGPIHVPDILALKPFRKAVLESRAEQAPREQSTIKE